MIGRRDSGALGTSARVRRCHDTVAVRDGIVARATSRALVGSLSCSPSLTIEVTVLANSDIVT